MRAKLWYIHVRVYEEGNGNRDPASELDNSEPNFFMFIGFMFMFAFMFIFIGCIETSRKC